MVTFPNCKINLGLNVLRKRPDGFHDLETIFYPGDIYDVLEIMPVSSSKFVFQSAGLPIDTTDENNLVVRAWQLLQQDFNIPSVSIFLYKAIPMGAGLGGGSSDAAHTLRMLNTIFKLGLTYNDLEKYALRLGSDCPFFIRNKPLLATGRGEVFDNINIDLSAFDIRIITPDVHVSTKEAYSLIKLGERKTSPGEIVKSPIETWKNKLFNDFEEVIIARYPKIGELKQKLYKEGAVYASMSGSGSAVYGIFPSTL